MLRACCQTGSKDEDARSDAVDAEIGTDMVNNEMEMALIADKAVVIGP